MDGDVAPLEEIVELARRHDVRVMVDEAHGIGALGPGGRGTVAEAGLEGEVDVVVGSLGKALGSYGAYVACDHVIARYLVNTARPLMLLDRACRRPRSRPRWRRSSCSRAAAARRAAARQRRARCATSWPARASTSPARRRQIVPLVVGDAALPLRICEAALEQACSRRPSARRACPPARRGCGSP